MDERPYGCRGRVALGVLGLMVMIFGCIGVTTLSIDAACYNSMTPKIPVYPNGRITLEQHNFLRAFGMGETVMIIDTDDEPNVVREWYGKTVGAAYKAAQDNFVPFFFLANARYSVGRAEDGTGTQIILNGVCGGG